MSSNAGISFKYYTYLDVGEFVDIPTLSGTIDVTYDGTLKSGQQVRIGLEIGEEANWYKWRDQNIFYGMVSKGKFDSAYIGKKYKIKGYELYDFRQWCMNPKTSSELVSGTWNSGIKITNSNISNGGNKAQVEFSRPLVTLYSETMDLVPNTSYLGYLSYGVFKSSTSNDKLAVKGAIKPNYHLSPHALVFKVDADTKSAETSNSGATKIEWAAAMLTAGAAFTALY